MKTTQKIAAVVLVLLLGATIYGLIRTTEPPSVPPSQGKGKPTSPAQAPLVDQSPLKTAQQLAQLPMAPDEKPFAEEALRLADHEVDSAYDAALRNARAHPPVLSAEAKEIEARLQRAQKLVASDKAMIDQLTAAVAGAKDEKKEALQGDLDQATEDLDVDQNDVDDAEQDLKRAGGDLAAPSRR